MGIVTVESIVEYLAARRDELKAAADYQLSRNVELGYRLYTSSTELAKIVREIEEQSSGSQNFNSD